MLSRLALGISACLTIFGWKHPDPGVAKLGRVVIDDAHSFEWEQSARRLDSIYYGDFSMYSFAALSEHLSRCYDVAIVTTSEAFRRALSSTDVLVLKTPEIDFTADEIESIEDFVMRGGGLFVIGDHTDLFRMNTRLNQVLAFADITLRADSVRSATNRYFVRARAPLLGKHPSLAGVEEFEFMTGCSVSVGSKSRATLTAKDVQVDPADYINSSSFPSWSNDGTQPCGAVPVMAAATIGRGRVVVLTDSTPLSSFDYYKGNYPEVMLSVLEWLNRENARWLGTLLGGVGLGIFLLVAWLRGLGWLIGIGNVVVVTFGSYIGLAAVTVAGVEYYPAISESAAPPDVAFLTEGCYAVFPHSLGGTGGVDSAAVFDTLYNLPLRMGRRSRTLATVAELATGASRRTGIVVNIVEDPGIDAATQLKSWVASGGQLILFQRAAAFRTPGIERVCGAFGVSLDLNVDNTPRLGGMSRVRSPVDVIAGMKRIEDGTMWFIISDDSFCNTSLGHSMGVPSPRQQGLHEFVLSLLRYNGPRFDLCEVRR